jgi:DnaJ-class molecular chaperone
MGEDGRIGMNDPDWIWWRNTNHIDYRQVSVDVRVRCWRCNGSGEMARQGNPARTARCLMCDGSGLVTTRQWTYREW